jgi:hypothetical protein
VTATVWSVLATVRLRKFQQLSLRVLKKLRSLSSEFLALVEPSLTQFRVRQQLV